MSAPEYSAADYLQALWNLMPRGRVWSRDQDSVQNLTLSGLAETFARMNSRANALIPDAFPQTTYELLPEWEETLGIPDECAPLGTTIQARQKAVLAKFIGTGGQSAGYYIDYAASLGFTITIKQYTPFRVGQQKMGDQLGGEEWAFHWDIACPAFTTTYFRTGDSAMGEALASWSNSPLICTMDKIKPAHTTLSFIYS